ncbi:MAG: hypothetical protein Q4A07_03680 [Coriobacteriales bacterium]|nr:hypothetical protein [Coriobacteriales bacterium]
MKETQALLRIQEIDIAIMRNKRTLANMPQVKKLQAIVAARKQLATQISKIVGLRKDADMDLEDNERSNARLKEIVAEVQERYTSGEANYRELADLESQLVSLAKRIEKYEFKHKDLVQKAQKAHVAEQNARDMDKKLMAEGESQMEALKRQSADIESEIRSLEAEREGLVAQVSEQTLKRYGEAFKRFGGLAVESIRGNQPSVCRVTIPPSSFGDLRRGPSITECPYCHRLLVTDGMFDLDS